MICWGISARIITPKESLLLPNARGMGHIFVSTGSRHAMACYYPSTYACQASIQQCCSNCVGLLMSHYPSGLGIVPEIRFHQKLLRVVAFIYSLVPKMIHRPLTLHHTLIPPAIRLGSLMGSAHGSDPGKSRRGI